MKDSSRISWAIIATKYLLCTQQIKWSLTSWIQYVPRWNVFEVGMSSWGCGWGCGWGCSGIVALHGLSQQFHFSFFPLFGQILSLSFSSCLSLVFWDPGGLLWCTSRAIRNLKKKEIIKKWKNEKKMTWPLKHSLVVS